MVDLILIKCYHFVHGDIGEKTKGTVQPAPCSKFERNIREVSSFEKLRGGHGHQNESSCDQPVPPLSTKMVLLPSLLLILACLSGSFGQEDLQKKVFVFPAANKKATVYLNVSFQEPLTNFTVCLRYFPLQFRPYTLFSYSTKQKSKAFQIVKPNAHTYNLVVGGLSQVIGPLKDFDAEWQHVCVAWNSTSGMVHCWLNGKQLPRFVMRKDYKMGQKGTIFLGHELDSWGKRECFLGEMADVNMWLRVLTDEEVNSVKKNDDVPNAWLRWRAFNYTAQGGACVEEALRQVS